MSDHLVSVLAEAIRREASKVYGAVPSPTQEQLAAASMRALKPFEEHLDRVASITLEKTDDGFDVVILMRQA